MNFEDWLNQIDGFEIRAEIAYYYLVSNPHPNSTEQWNRIRNWLKKAFQDGMESNKEKILELQNIINLHEKNNVNKE